jgi:hypothetical protein
MSETKPLSKELAEMLLYRGMRGEPRIVADDLLREAVEALASGIHAVYDTRTHCAVPMEPTKEMISQGYQRVTVRIESDASDIPEIYAAMLAAAEPPR